MIALLYIVIYGKFTYYEVNNFFYFLLEDGIEDNSDSMIFSNLMFVFHENLSLKQNSFDSCLLAVG